MKQLKFHQCITKQKRSSDYEFIDLKFGFTIKNLNIPALGKHDAQMMQL